MADESDWELKLFRAVFPDLNQFVSGVDTGNDFGPERQQPREQSPVGGISDS